MKFEKNCIEVPMINWKHDLSSFKNYIEDNTRVIFVANPNNPTGTYNTNKELNLLESLVPVLILMSLLAYNIFFAQS